jgi:hypothetical protein
MSRRTAFATAIAFLAVMPSLAPAAPAPYRHVVLVSIDGLHEADVTDPRLAAEIPVLRRLARSGVSYADARTTAPSDSFPGTLAYLTGAGPGTTGVYYDETYDRTLTAPGAAADAPRGSVVDLTEDLDRDPTLLDGGGDAGAGSIDPAKLPQRCGAAGCAPLWPHDYPFANTLFDVLGAHGMRSLLVEKHPAYAVAFARGARYMSFYAPEIAAQVAIDHGRLIDRSNPHAADVRLAPVGDVEATAEAYDERKLQAVLGALAGRGPDGVPTLVVLNLQSVNFAQKAAAGGTAADGLPSPRLRRALRYADGAVGRIAALLAARGSAADTLLVVFAKHGQAPRRGRATLVARSAILRPLRRAGIGVAHLTSDDIAMLWLGDRSNAARAARVLAPLGRVVPGVPGPSSAVVRRERAPDLVLVPRPGVVFVGNPAKATKRAEHGGFSPDDRDVPLIVWSSRLGAAAGRSVAVPVETRQIAPTVLAALGLHARELSGVRAEGTRPLPGLPLP